MNANLRNFALWVIIVLLLLALFTLFQNPGQRAGSADIPYSQFLNEVDKNNVKDVTSKGADISGEFKNKAIPDALKEAIQAATYGNIVGLTRQEMIFDKSKLLQIYDETAEKEPM